MNTTDLTERISFRTHPNDKQLLLKLIADMGMSIQDFGTACTDAFLRGDPHMLKAVMDWKKLNQIPKEHRDRYTMSQRERDEMLREIENEEMNTSKGK